MGNESDKVGTTRFVVHAGSEPALASQPADDFVAAVVQRTAQDDFVKLAEAKPRRRRRRRRLRFVGAVVVLAIVVGIAILSFPESRQWIGIVPSDETPATTIVAVEPANAEADIQGAGRAEPNGPATTPPGESTATPGVWQPGMFRESETGSTVRYVLPPGTPPIPREKPAVMSMAPSVTVPNAGS